MVETGGAGASTYTVYSNAVPVGRLPLPNVSPGLPRSGRPDSGIRSRVVGVVLPQPIQFGKYTLFERIGRGGMADVFKGRVQGPAGFERVFVVKRILPHLSDDPTFNRMFIDEAKMSARHNQPNIVQVFELGAVDGEYFISMEYVRGRDLAETMRTLWARIGPPRPELVAYVGREMCRALGYAHDLTADDGSPLGMIHRDVSPSNVMLSYEGTVKILDFGIAKALGGKNEDEGGTQRGTLKGKFAYMAPEQTQGNDVDKRIDIFAAGIVLHEVLTGRRLFKGDNDLQTVEKVRQCDVPPPSLQNPLCPPELDAVILKALSRNRDDRYQTGADMADALDDVVHAARFQPSHLAQLMRDLFPQDVGGGHAPGDPRTTGARIAQSMTGSNSRPLSAPLRSPTVPPLSVSRSHSTGNPAPNIDPASLALPREKPLLQRASIWVAMIVLVGLGVGATTLWTQSQAPTRPVGAGAGGLVSRRPSGPVTVIFNSIPEHADVYERGTNKHLGQTPFSLRLELAEDRDMIVVFKKANYQDEVRKVYAYKPVFPTLRSVLPATEPVAPRAATEAAPAPTPVPKSSTQKVPPSAGPIPGNLGDQNPAAPPSRPALDPAPRHRAPGSSAGKKTRGTNEVLDPF